MSGRDIIFTAIAVFIGTAAALALAALIAKQQIQQNVSTNSILAALIK